MTTFSSRQPDDIPDDAYRSWLISRQQPAIIHHSHATQLKRLRVVMRHAANAIRRYCAAVRVALAADALRRDGMRPQR